MSKDGRLFSISVNMAVFLQSLAAMELVSTDRELERLVTPCSRPCGDLWLRLEKVDKQTARYPFLPCLGRFGKTAFNHAGRECRAAKNGGETGGGGQGRNVCRLKDGWLLQAPWPEKRRPARPCGKRKCHPEIWGTAKLGGIKKGIRRKQGILVGGTDVNRKK